MLWQFSYIMIRMYFVCLHKDHLTVYTQHAILMRTLNKPLFYRSGYWQTFVNSQYTLKLPLTNVCQCQWWFLREIAIDKRLSILIFYVKALLTNVCQFWFLRETTIDKCHEMSWNGEISLISPSGWLRQNCAHLRKKKQMLFFTVQSYNQIRTDIITIIQQRS